MADTATPRRQRRLATIQSDIKASLDEVAFLQSAAPGPDAVDSVTWALARLEYAREALKGLKGDFTS